MEIIKIEDGSVLKDGSVLIDTKKGFNIWVDYWTESDELFIDWNAYIFNLKESTDLKIKEFQESVENFEICSSLVYDHVQTLKQGAK